MARSDDAHRTRAGGVRRRAAAAARGPPGSAPTKLALAKPSCSSLMSKSLNGPGSDPGQTMHTDVFMVRSCANGVTTSLGCIAPNEREARWENSGKTYAVVIVSDITE